MTTLNEVKAEIEKLPCVYSASIWNERRVYVNLIGQDKSWNGDRTARVYFESKLGWVIDKGKGFTSTAFQKSLDDFASSLPEKPMVR
jgi:hypothetical protein